MSSGESQKVGDVRNRGVWLTFLILGAAVALIVFLDSRRALIPAGEVLVMNVTDQNVVVTSNYYLDLKGRRIARGDSWEVAPQSSVYLTDRRGRIRAAEIEYQLVANQASSAARVQKLDANGKIVIAIRPDNLPYPSENASGDPAGAIHAAGQTLDAAARLARLAQEGAPGAREESDLILTALAVSPARADGGKWDDEAEADGESPDLFVRVRNIGRRGSAVEGVVHSNTPRAMPNERLARVAAGDKIEIAVFDKDANGDEEIGRHTEQITERLLDEGKASWSFGSVVTFDVAFER